MTQQVALFDTNSGYLQWIGEAESHRAAIRAHLQEIGYNEDVEYGFLALDVSDEEADALQRWVDHGSRSSDYPEDLPTGVRYDTDEVRSLLC